LSESGFTEFHEIWEFKDWQCSLRWTQDFLGFKNLEYLTHDLNRMILHVMLNLMAVTLER